MSALFCTLIPVAALPPALILLQRCYVHPASRLHRLAVVGYAVYLYAVFQMTGLPDIQTTAGDAEISWRLFPILREERLGFCLNILLFGPLGIALPLVFGKRFTFVRTVLFGFALSMMIELLQLLNFRITDVQDLAANTLGTAVGYGLLQPIRRRCAPLFASDAQEILEAGFILWLVFLYYFYIPPMVGYLSGL